MIDFSMLDPASLMIGVFLGFVLALIVVARNKPKKPTQPRRPPEPYPYYPDYRRRDSRRRR